MIIVPVSVEITGGTAPYTFSFTSNSSDVTFSDVTGTAYSSGSNTYSASTDIEYLNQTDITTAIVTVTFTDANGCSKVLSPVVVSNPCTMQSTLSNNGEFVFIATTTGGSGGYSYDWNYNTTLFSEVSGDTSENDNYLSLVLNEGVVIPSSALIAVLITDTNGCELYKTIVYNFCRPNLQTQTFSLVCDPTAVSGCTNTVSQKRNVDLKPNMKVCTGQTIDWSTLNFNVPVGLCVNHLGNGIIDVSSNLDTMQTKNITYTVESTSGILSSTGTLAVTIPTCTAGRNPFTGVPQTIQLTIEDIVSDTRLLNVESRVGGTPDWSTFAFVGSPTWGTVTFNGNRDIVYTITNVATTPTIPDTISWTLNDYSGGQINITDTVLRNRIALPVMTGEIICLTCGETSTPQDILANDTGDIDRSTLTFTTIDPDITIVKDTDNNIIFTVSPTVQAFSNTSVYKVANTQGAFSATANAIVATVCSGTPDDFDLTCQVSKAFDLLDRFIDPIGLNWVLTETTTTAPTYITQGGTITNPTSNGAVNFAAITTGRTYTFQLATENTASCPGVFDYQEVEIYHGVTPHITFGTAVNNANGTSTYPFTYSGLASAVYITLNGSAATFQTPPMLTNGSGTFTLYNVAGLNTVVISATSVCSATINDTDATLTI